MSDQASAGRSDADAVLAEAAFTNENNPVNHLRGSRDQPAPGCTSPDS
jgi:hypothetical protein